MLNVHECTALPQLQYSFHFRHVIDDIFEEYGHICTDRQTIGRIQMMGFVHGRNISYKMECTWTEHYM